MTYSTQKQREVRANRKHNFEIIRLLMDIVKENPDMKFSSIIHALNLHQVPVGESSKETAGTMQKWVHQFYLVKNVRV